MEKIPVKPNILRQMFPLQKDLLTHYITIEGLPPYPVDLNTKLGQRTIKDFVRRFIEELSEAFSEMIEAYQFISSNRSPEAKKRLQAYNIELADAWHFMLELLIYLGIEEEVLEELIPQWMEDRKIPMEYKEGDPLKMLSLIADWVNQQRDEGKCIRNTPDRFRIVEESQAFNSMDLVGGRRVSEQLINQHATYLWHLTHGLNKMTNLLQNREWNQAERLANKIKIYEAFMDAFFQWVVYMDFIGATHMSIYTCYFHKNQENLNRIKSGY